MISGPEPEPSPRSAFGVRFRLGKLFITPAAQQFLAEEGVAPSQLLLRHSVCDWGDVDEEDWAANDRGLGDGTRLFSAYEIQGASPRVWVITEADRSSTAILMPDDY